MPLAPRCESRTNASSALSSPPGRSSPLPDTPHVSSTHAAGACAVVRCEPTVPDVQSLVDALNTSNDFSAFVRNMRKRFQQLVRTAPMRPPPGCTP